MSDLLTAVEGIDLIIRVLKALTKNKEYNSFLKRLIEDNDDLKKLRQELAKAEAKLLGLIEVVKASIPPKDYAENQWMRNVQLGDLAWMDDRDFVVRAKMAKYDLSQEVYLSIIDAKREVLGCRRFVEHAEKSRNDVKESMVSLLKSIVGHSVKESR